jgi:proteasome accessory factor C
MAAKKPVNTASDNLLLLLALVPFVLDRQEVSVAEAAAQFGRSEDDIIRAVELIACAGVPGDSTAYSHLDLFDIDWDLFEKDRRITFWNTVALDHKPRFSAREASALLAGLQYLSHHPAYSTRSDVADVMEKLRQGSGRGPSGRIAISQPATKAHLQLLNDAIDSHVAIETMYHNKRGESGRRTIDPWVLESRDGTWYLRGFCHTRQAVRTFRVDHMDTVVVTNTPQADRSEGLRELSPELFQPSSDDIVVTLECHISALPLIADYLPRGMKTPGTGERVSLEIPFAHYGSLTQFMGTFSHLVKVTAPPSAKKAVSGFAAAALMAY